MGIFNFDFIILFTGPEFNEDQYFDCDKRIKRVPYFYNKTGVSWILFKYQYETNKGGRGGFWEVGAKL